MSVKEMIVELSKMTPDAEVVFEWPDYPHCDCNARGVRCYCSEETRRASTNTVDPFGDVVVIRGEAD